MFFAVTTLISVVCRRYVPRYCSLGSDVKYHGAGGVSAVVVV